MITFSIVTPSYNSERFLRETIESVLSQQGDFSIEYILADGGSTDATLEIFEEYKNKNTDPRITMTYFSGKDRGMYDAINQGFARATGDIYAWINSDDTYQPGAIETIRKCAEQFPQIEWFKGRTSVMEADGTPRHSAPCYIYNQQWILRGIYGRNAYFIHQDSVFWRASLWQKAGPIDTSLRYAGDYWLWIHFAKHAELYSVDALLSNFRRVEDSLSLHDSGAKYRAEVVRISPNVRDLFETKVKVFFMLTSKFPFLTPLWRRIYPAVFAKRQKEYIRIVDGTPTLTPARSYIA